MTKNNNFVVEKLKKKIRKTIKIYEQVDQVYKGEKNVSEYFGNLNFLVYSEIYFSERALCIIT